MRPPQLADVLRRQCDLFTRAQAREAGLTDAAIRWGLARHWHSAVSYTHLDVYKRQRLI